MSSDDWIISPKELARVLRDHKQVAIRTFAAITIAALAISLVSPSVYRAQAKLFVRLGRENATLDPTATLGSAPVVVSAQPRENEINTAAEILKSRILFEKVIDVIGAHVILGKSKPSDSASEDELAKLRYKAVELLNKSVEVEPSKKSNVVSLTFDAPSIEVAERVLAKIIDVYLERHIQLNRTPEAKQFLIEQTRRQKESLTKAEEELREVKVTTGLADPTVQRQLMVNRLSRLQDELLQSESIIASTEAEIKLMKDGLSTLKPTQITATTSGVRNEAADNMRGQLYTLQLHELQLRQKYPDGHPEIERVKEQTAAAREILRREEHDREQITEGPNRVFEETQLSLSRQEILLNSQRAKATILRAQLERQQGDLRKFNEDSLRIVRLERDITLADSHYRRYAENLEQAQIDRAMEIERISNISIVQPAICDPNPVRPKPLLYFSVGVVLAAISALGGALVVDWRKRSSLTPV